MDSETLNLLKWILGIPAALTTLITVPLVIRKFLLEIKKLKNEVKTLEKDKDEIKSSHFKTAEGYSSRLNYKFEEIEIEGRLQHNGKIKFTRKYKLEVTNGTLESLDFSQWVFGDNRIDNYKRKVSGWGDNCDIEDSNYQKTERGVKYLVKFVPFLAKKAEFKIIEEFYGGITLTMEELQNQMEMDGLFLQEPYENHSHLMRTEVNKFTLKAIFPINYEIRSKEFWDVMIGYTRNRSQEEYNRIKQIESNCFHIRTTKSERTLSLEIPNAKPGNSYWIKWQPPYEKDNSLDYGKSTR